MKGLGYRGSTPARCFPPLHNRETLAVSDSIGAHHYLFEKIMSSTTCTCIYVSMHVFLPPAIGRDPNRSKTDRCVSGKIKRRAFIEHVSTSSKLRRDSLCPNTRKYFPVVAGGSVAPFATDDVHCSISRSRETLEMRDTAPRTPKPMKAGVGVQGLVLGVPGGGFRVYSSSLGSRLHDWA